MGIHLDTLALLLLTAVALCMVWLGWREARRPLPYRLARVVALEVMLATMVVMAMRPSYTRTYQVPATMLLTQGYDPRVADSVRSRHPELKVLQAADELTVTPAVVLGDGIDADVLRAHPSMKFFYCAGSTKGLSKLEVPDAVVGTPAFIRGTLTTDQPATLLLEGPGGVEDSLLLKAGKNVFRLTCTPRQTGTPGYFLALRSATGIDWRSELPLQVKEAQPLSIRIQLVHPNPDTRFLKNWLGQEGHRLAVRTQVSGKVWREEWVNQSPAPTTLTATSLAQTDLLIFDADSWKQLSSAERAQIRQAAGSGLGVLLLTAEGTNITQYPGFAAVKTNSDSVQLAIGDTTLHVAATPSTSLPAQQVHYSDGAAVIAAATPVGSGLYAFQSVHETYRLAAAGLHRTYRTYWTSLINPVARRQARTTMIAAPHFPTTAGSGMTATVVAEGNPTLQLDGTTLPLLEDWQVDGVWSTETFAPAPGWHTLVVPQQDTVRWLVSGENDWRGLQAVARQAANLAHHTDVIDVQPHTVTRKQPVSPWLLLTVWLVAAAGLWLLPRL